MNQKLQNRSTVDWTLLSVRLASGIIMSAHGSQKLFGAFGGPGISALVAQMGPIGYLVAVGEFFGGLGLLLSVLPRFSAAANIVIMLGAIATVHGKNGFFMSTMGYEFCLAMIGLLVPTLVAGPGRFSVSEKIPLRRLLPSRTPSQAGA